MLHQNSIKEAIFGFSSMEREIDLDGIVLWKAFLLAESSTLLFPSVKKLNSKSNPIQAHCSFHRNPLPLLKISISQITIIIFHHYKSINFSKSVLIKKLRYLSVCQYGNRNVLAYHKNISGKKQTIEKFSNKIFHLKLIFIGTINDVIFCHVCLSGFPNSHLGSSY